MWFELKSSGFPALAVGLGVAMLIFLLFAISIPVEVVRPFAVFSHDDFRAHLCCSSSSATPSEFAGDKDARTPARSR